MRDGVELVADHYEPVGGTSSAPCWSADPMAAAFPFSLIFGDLHAARGYRVMLQSVRGTFGSGGVFEPMVNEVADGADTVAWMRRQPWFTGRFATIGISYLGFTQWAMLQDPPPELAAAVITAGPHDFSASAWGTGSFTVNDFLGWSNLVAHQEDPGRIRAGIRQLRAQKNVIRAAGEVPLGAAGRTLLGDGATWWEKWLNTPMTTTRSGSRCESPPHWTASQVPVLLLSGWQDLFLPQTLQQYRQLRDRGVEVALTMGPWTHTQLLLAGLPTIARETQDWLDTHLGGRPAAPRSSRVRFFVRGEGWRELPDWPPDDHRARAVPAARRRPGRDARRRRDPRRAFATTRPSRHRRSGAGCCPPTAVTATTARWPLAVTCSASPATCSTEDLCVLGQPGRRVGAQLRQSVTSTCSSGSAKSTPRAARATSATPTAGWTAARDATPSRLELDAIAHRFRAGTRIRVLIAGGSHPALRP